MRTLWSVLGLLAVLLQAPPSLAAQFLGWMDTGGKAHTIAVGADGTVWVLSFNKVGAAGDSGLHRWDPRNRAWKVHPIGGGVQLAVDPAGNPWVINTAGDISKWTGEGWDRLPGKGKAIGIGADGTVWVIGMNPVGSGDFGLHRWDARSRTWKPLSSTGGVTVAVDPKGNPWVVNAEGDIARWTGSTWERLPGKAKSIGIGAEGTAWILGSNPVGHGDYGLHRWNAQTKAWEPLETGGGVALAVAPDGFPAVINSRTQVFLSLTTEGPSVWDRLKKNLRDFLSRIRGG